MSLELNTANCQMSLQQGAWLPDPLPGPPLHSSAASSLCPAYLPARLGCHQPPCSAAKPKKTSNGGQPLTPSSLLIHASPTALSKWHRRQDAGQHQGGDEAAYATGSCHILHGLVVLFVWASPNRQRVTLTVPNHSRL